MEENVITVECTVFAPMKKVWECWTEPEHIVNWCAASDDWHAPRAENDLKVGGKFTTVMAAKDGSMSFDFGGIYTEVKEFEKIAYTMGDDRKVSISFADLGDGVKVTESFEMEHANSYEMQKSGWQSILDNFKKYTEK